MIQARSVTVEGVVFSMTRTTTRASSLHEGMWLNFEFKPLHLKHSVEGNNLLARNPRCGCRPGRH